MLKQVIFKSYDNIRYHALSILMLYPYFGKVSLFSLDKKLKTLYFKYVPTTFLGVSLRRDKSPSRYSGSLTIILSSSLINTEVSANTSSK